MNIATITIILVSISLSVAAQILLKLGMSSPHVQQALNTNITHAITATLSNTWVLGGLFSYTASAAVWLIVLSKTDVSKAYPFVGLGFVATMIFAYWFLNEPLTAIKIAGTILVVLGVLLISQS